MNQRTKLSKILNPQAPIFYDGKPPLSHDEISALILLQGHGRLNAQKIKDINKHKNKEITYWTKILKSLVFKEFIEKADQSRPVEYELRLEWRNKKSNYFTTYKPNRWYFKGYKVIT